VGETKARLELLRGADEMRVGEACSEHRCRDRGHRQNDGDHHHHLDERKALAALAVPP
jgi:hypothetical protein